MNFYADNNIFGMNEIILLNYKFRSNLDEISMKKLEKSILVPNNNIDLISLYKEKPELFSHLTKNSSCYIEIDTHYESMANQFEYLLNSSIQTPSKTYSTQEKHSQLMASKERSDFFKLNQSKEDQEVYYKLNIKKLYILSKG